MIIKRQLIRDNFYYIGHADELHISDSCPNFSLITFLRLLTIPLIHFGSNENNFVTFFLKKKTLNKFQLSQRQTSPWNVHNPEGSDLIRNPPPGCVIWIIGPKKYVESGKPCGNSAILSTHKYSSAGMLTHLFNSIKFNLIKNEFYLIIF